MARPTGMKTRIFLDGSDLQEMKDLESMIGFLDGQTTNPSNFVKALKKEQGTDDLSFEKDELYGLYKKRVQEISQLVPDGSVSIEVYADASTTSEQMLEQAREMYTWIPNAHIKLPIIPEGLKTAQQLVSEGVRVNMTLCFNQEQAAAVYAATKGAKKGDVFISPFIGRVDDKGKNGMDLIKNILQMYTQGDGHVEVLSASIRTGDQLAEAIAVGSDITTSYLKAIVEWADTGMEVKDPSAFSHEDLEAIPYKDISLDQPWEAYNIQHDMTDDGLRRFADDWNKLIKG